MGSSSARAPGDGAPVVAVALAAVLSVALLSLPSLQPPPTAATAATAGSRSWTAAAPVLPSPPVEAQVAPAPEPVLPDAPLAAAEVTAEAAPAAVPSEPARPAVAATGDHEERGRVALSGLRYPWQELGYGIRFEPWRGQGLLGVTDPATRTITVFVRPRQSDHSLRVTLAHEIGHALDLVTGTEAQRRRYLELRGVSPDTAWYPCDGCSDYASPAGDWAEVFALWAAGRGDFRSQLAAEPDDEQLQRIVPLFAPPSARQQTAAPAAPRPSPSPTRRPLLPIVP